MLCWICCTETVLTSNRPYSQGALHFTSVIDVNALFRQPYHNAFLPLSGATLVLCNSAKGSYFHAIKHNSWHVVYSGSVNVIRICLERFCLFSGRMFGLSKTGDASHQRDFFYFFGVGVRDQRCQGYHGFAMRLLFAKTKNPVARQANRLLYGMKIGRCLRLRHLIMLILKHIHRSMCFTLFLIQLPVSWLASSKGNACFEVALPPQ